MYGCLVSEGGPGNQVLTGCVFEWIACPMKRLGIPSTGYIDDTGAYRAVYGQKREDCTLVIIGGELPKCRPANLDGRVIPRM